MIAGQALAQAPGITYYVSTAGSDTADGLTPQTALRTLAAAWQQIPMGVPLDMPVTVVMLPGVYTSEDAPNYWESRYGTADAPITIRADAPNTVYLPTINMFDVRHIRFVNLNIEVSEFDPFHCERCEHLLLDTMTIRGAAPETYATQEAVKINQSQHVHIRSSDISGGWDNAIDFVAVQYGSITGSAVHHAGDWCAYAKGGSAYIEVTGNTFHHCGTGGFTAGQGTGFQFMVPPWLQYEAYDVLIADNLFHDLEGAAVGVQGGYQVRVARNLAVRVGRRSHVLEFTYGQRTCDGSPDDGDPVRANCARYMQMGGWGTDADSTTTDVFVAIPNRHVYVYDNLIYNPAPYQSQYQHFFIPGPYDGPGQAGSGLGLVRADDDLRIFNNVIINGDDAMSVGVEAGYGTPGCQPDNPTCNLSQLTADNAINSASVAFAPAPDPAYVVISAQQQASPHPAFPPWDVPAPAPSQPLLPAPASGPLTFSVPADVLKTTP
jgi:hypothetical protein